MSVTNWWAALLCGAALSLPVVAQEDSVPTEPSTASPSAETAPASPDDAPKKKGPDDPPLHRWGGFEVSLAVWNPQLLGAQEELATTSIGGTAQPLYAGSEADVRALGRVEWLLPRDAGSVVAHYVAMEHLDEFEDLTPGEFGFAETRAFPLLLGAFDDGLADGVRANTMRRTREFRLEFTKRAFDSRWAKGTWGAGVRNIDHSRQVAISYLAVVPNLPPLVPPIVPDTYDESVLAPHPDNVSQSSSLSGNGIGASLDVEFPLHPRISVISGVSVGVIRGKAKSQYSSESSFYRSRNFVTPDNPDGLVPQDEFLLILSNGPQSEILALEQRSVVTGFATTGVSIVAETFDLYVGLEATLYRGLKVFATLREMYYANVGEYVAPSISFSNDRTALSAGYEGYTVGLSWRY